MRIGIVVDGDSEYESLGLLYAQIHAQVPGTLLSPRKADIQPLAPIGAIARACKSRISELEGRDATDVVIILDRENRPECPGDLAQSIAAAAQQYSNVPVAVVVKNTCYENWLIADPGALLAQPGRFELPQNGPRAVSPNKADNVNGQQLLGRWAKDGYVKRADARRILSRASVEAIAGNSRSFRKFLSVVQWPRYANQSREP